MAGNEAVVNKREILNKKFNDIVSYAYTNVPFYINLTRAEQDIPVIDKSMIEDERDLMAVQYTYGYQKDMVKVETSGSTGKCMEIYWDKHEHNKSMLPLWIYRYKYYDIKTNDRFCYFYTVGNQEESISGKTFYEETTNALGFSKSNLDSERILQICKMIKEYNPVWMNTQPSIAVLLARCFKKNHLGKPENLRYMELTGEMLFDSVRREIQEIFDCKMANQYGCYEANSIAYECPYGNMHCMEDNIYVEILDDDEQPVMDNQEGNIVITTLNSHVMPFIRYKTGDMGIVEKKHLCKCGNHSPIIRLTSGRISDYAIMRDGSEVSSYVFVRAVELVNRQCENVIKQFRVTQKEHNYFLVDLVLDEEVVDAGIHESEVENIFLQSVNDERLYDTEFEFRYFDGLEPKAGERKLRYFMREI